MKKISGILLLVGILIAIVSWKSDLSEEAGQYIKWFAKNKLYKAEGSFGAWEIKNVNYKEGDIESLSLDVEVDINSVNEKNDKLVHHLKQDDYFNIAVFPNATINVSNVEATDTAYKATFITTIKSIADTSEAYFKVLSQKPTVVEGYSYINRPKHLIGIPLKKSKGITEMVKVDFKVAIPTE